MNEEERGLTVLAILVLMVALAFCGHGCAYEYRGDSLQLTCDAPQGVEYLPAYCTMREDVIEGLDQTEWTLTDGRVCRVKLVRGNQ